MATPRGFLIGLALLGCLCRAGMAGETPEREAHGSPVLVSLVTPLQVPDRASDVWGLRLSLLYGVCRDLDGLDIGLAGLATGDANGVQLALAANVVDGGGMGVQIAPVSVVRGGTYAGFQCGIANYALRAKSLQVGVVNAAGHLEGCQIGLVNVADTLYGLQIGLVNVIRDHDVPFLPIVNGYF